DVSLVHLHTCSGFSFARSCLDMLAARRRRCRVVLHVHGAMFDGFVRRQPLPLRRTIAHMLARADAVVALSHGWAGKLAALAPRARIRVIENAVEVPPAVPDRTGGSPCRFVLLAKMDAWKGVDDLLDASARLAQTGAPFLVTLAGPPGSAGDAKTLKQKIERRGLAGLVHYAGPVVGSDKERLLREADIYVQPSRHEGMPLSVLEAMAVGLPVVATRVGSLPEVLEHERTALLVPPGDPARLAAAMQRLIRDLPRRRAMSSSCHRLARERFSLERLERDLIALYDGILHPRRTPQAASANEGVSPLPATLPSPL
ncbi:MAG: glycosyltransferase family 1 protein, partial [Planctomycetota bacterium]